MKVVPWGSSYRYNYSRLGYHMIPYLLSLYTMYAFVILFEILQSLQNIFLNFTSALSSRG